MIAKHEFTLLLLLVGFCFPIIYSVPAKADNLLGDPGFEESTPNGNLPDSDYWVTVSEGPAALSICTEDDGRSGNGLYQYTGVDEDSYRTYIYQQLNAAPGDLYQGHRFQ